MIRKTAFGCMIRAIRRILPSLLASEEIAAMPYLYLAAAIVAEVVATSSLKASQEFTRLVPSLLVVVGYGISFFMLTLVLRTLPVGIVYAV